MDIVIHYGEIGTKGKNRKQFEEQLISNIKQGLEGNYSKIQRRYGKIVVIDAKNKKKAKETLSLMPGIANFAFAEKVEKEFEIIKKKTFEKAKKLEFDSFKVETIRSDKTFPMKSGEVSREVGGEIFTKLKKKVKLKNPEVTFFIEIGEKHAYIYHEKFQGIGGLPIGSSGKVVVMLSGGIDSPVAAYMMMKRGCSVVLCHFMNETVLTKESEKKVDKIVKVLEKIQPNIKLIKRKFNNIQKEIIKKVPAKYRMIIYRRFMTKITNLVARKERARAIVTGDSIGQVASQTMKNINCIYNAADYPLFSPLIGLNKQEIVNISKQIGTYEVSILPYADCCSYMIAEHPETAADLKDILEIEKNLDKDLIK